MQPQGDLSESRQEADKNSVPLFSVQHRIQILQQELRDFNERIAELESAGHRGRTIEVLKANAMDFARQIDELRCFLVQPTTKRESPGLHSRRQTNGFTIATTQARASNHDLK
jgi:hypothetical protein